MKPFDRLIKILKSKTDEQIIAEVEAYPKCGECPVCGEIPSWATGCRCSRECDETTEPEVSE